MSEHMDIDSGYDARDRDASPRRDRPAQRDRSPRRYNDNFRDRRGGRDSYRDSYRDSRDSRDSRDAPRGSKSDRNYSNSIFVGNIPYDCDPSRLKDFFSSAGNVIRADIVTQNGRPRGMATVEFSSKDEVNRAIQDFNHSTFMERDIFVRQDNPPPEDRGSRGGYGRDDRYGGRRDDYRRDDRYGGRSDDYRRDDRYGGRRDDYRRDDRYGGRRDDYRRDDRFGGRRDERPPRTGPIYEVFVGNLPFSINWQALKDIFREAGNITRADVRQDYNGRSRGFGIVAFDNAEGVASAIEKFNGYTIEGRSIDVREGKNNGAGSSSTTHAESNNNTDTAGFNAASSNRNSEFTSKVSGNGPKSDTIYVDNLPFATTNEDLHDLFETVGSVSRAEIIYGGDDRPAGKAVVQFGSEEAAAGAVERLDNYDYGDRPLKISFAQRD